MLVESCSYLLECPAQITRSLLIDHPHRVAQDAKGLTHLAILLSVSGEVRRVLSDESFHLRNR